MSGKVTFLIILESIILDDGEVHIEEITSMNKKFSGGNSLFDGKFIR